MRRAFAVFMAVCSLVLLASDPAPASVPVPETLVRTTTRDVLDAIKKDNLVVADKRFRDMVEAKALPNFDFTRMTALAVGKHWRSATPEQQAALVREFRNLLVRTYSTALTANKVQSIDVKPTRMSDTDTDVVIKTEVTVSNAQSFPIDYRMLKVGNSWKVYDVAVEGVSLVTNYRASFNQSIQKDGIDGLIKALQDRNMAQSSKAAG